MLLIDDDVLDLALAEAATEIDHRVLTRAHTMTAGEIQGVFRTLIRAVASSSDSAPSTPATAPGAPDGGDRR